MLLSETLERDRADLQRLGDLGRGDLAERYRQAADRLAALERGDLGFGHGSPSRSDLVRLEYSTAAVTRNSS